MNRKYLYFTVFASGMTTLAVELTASRLLGSVFGTSNLVWASIIGLILIYLTLGYFLGGRWADRRPHIEPFYTILAWGAFSSGIVPFFSRPVLRLAADAFDDLRMGVLIGSFVAVLVLFIIPITLLGTISPYAIRLALDDPQKAGQISGKIYAISTLGSFVGTFIPVIVLIPLIGTTFTFLVFALFLNLVALFGLWRGAGSRAALKWSWMPVLLGLLAILWGRGDIKASYGQIYETESAYNYIQVQEIGEYRYLRLNEGQGIHSVYHPEQLNFQGPWMQVLAAPFFNPAPYELEQVESLAVIGLAAGTISNQATDVFGAIPIDGFEIDPEIIRVGQEFFGMTQPNLNPLPQDGRWGLDHSPRKYSIISIDAYRPPYIPWHLTTREFFQIVYDHMAEDGVLAINVGRAPNDRRLIEGLIETISTLFPSIYVMDIPDTFNSIIYATVQPTLISDLHENFQIYFARTDAHPLLLESLQRAIAFMQPNPCDAQAGQPADGCIVFTDDLAPIEWITNNMILNYVFFGGIEELQ
ncbi:MAG: fused MFS/spermidine synthase [Anaerolineales bacterium]|nr:fused MFS/spermidine synthase [Chloroflexota bacterium]MBL6983912.1 fused MFS/spermidine synthase [Anaerolineales bacterium]